MHRRRDHHHSNHHHHHHHHHNVLWWGYDDSSRHVTVPLHLLCLTLHIRSIICSSNNTFANLLEQKSFGHVVMVLTPSLLQQKTPYDMSMVLRKLSSVIVVIAFCDRAHWDSVYGDEWSQLLDRSGIVLVFSPSAHHTLAKNVSESVVHDVLKALVGDMSPANWPGRNLNMLCYLLVAVCQYLFWSGDVVVSGDRSRDLLRQIELNMSDHNLSEYLLDARINVSQVCQVLLSHTGCVLPQSYLKEVPTLSPLRGKGRRSSKSSPPLKQQEEWQVLIGVVTSGDKDPIENAVVHPDFFQDVEVGEVLEVIQEKPTTNSMPKNESFADVFSSGVPYVRNLFQVEKKVDRRGTCKLWVADAVANKFAKGDLNFANTQLAFVRRMAVEEVSLDFVEVSFQTQYIGRSDMWQLREEMRNHIVYTGHKLESLGMTIFVDRCLMGGSEVTCGVIAEHTKFIFRSRSARLFWLIQLSEEMWEFDNDGMLYFEKLLMSLRSLCTEWNAKAAKHLLSIVLFSRTYYDEPWETMRAQVVPQSDNQRKVCKPKHLLQRDDKGRLFQDHFKIIRDCVVLKDWSKLLIDLKSEFAQYPSLMKWAQVDPVTQLRGSPAPASVGNMLEAMNLCVTVFEKHYIDRSLTLTGQSITIFTACSGAFYCNRELYHLTKQRMIDNGIGCDIISFTEPGLHQLPLFVLPAKPGPDTMFTHNGTAVEYCVPKWLEIKFFDRTNYSHKGEVHRSGDHHHDENDGGDGAFQPFAFSRWLVDSNKDSQNDNTLYEKAIAAPAIPPPVLTFTERSEYEEYDRSVFSMKRPTAENWRPIRPSDSSPTLNLLVTDRSPNKHSMSPDFPFEPQSPGVPIATSGRRSGSGEKRMGSLDKYQALSPPRSKSFDAKAMDASIHAAHPKLWEATGEVSVSGASRELILPLSDEVDMQQSKAGASGDAVLSRQVLNFSSRNMNETVVVESLNLGEARAVDPDLPEYMKPATVSTTVFQDYGTALNPFRVQEEPLQFTANQRRWNHVFATIPRLGDVRTVNFPSLVTPAILPLTTDYFPSDQEIIDNYLVYFHDISSLDTNDQSNRSRSQSDRVMNELICQRLAQDYQLAVVDRGATCAINERTAPSDTTVTYYLGCCSQFHAITLDPYGSIGVRRFVLKTYGKNNIELDAKKKSSETPVSTPNGINGGVSVDTATAVDVSPSRPSETRSDGTRRTDDHTSGGGGGGGVGVHRRTRTRRLPMALRRNRQKAMQREDGSKKKMKGPTEGSARKIATQLRIPYRYFLWDEYQCGWSVQLRDIAAHHDNFNWNYCDEMICGHFDEFLGNLKQRRVRFCLLPSLEDNSNVEQRQTRNKQFIEFMCQILSFHGNSKDDTKGALRFLDVHVCEKERTPAEVKVATPVISESFTRLSAGFALPGNHVMRSRKVNFVGKAHSSRDHWGIVEYDSVYDASSCYHLELQWLAASGCAVSSWTETLRRKAKHKLQYVQIPAFFAPLQEAHQHGEVTSDPFHRAVPISVPIELAIQVKHVLVSEFDFLPDVHRSQYIHKTGCAAVRCVQRTNTFEFIWISNYLGENNQQRQEDRVSLFRDFSRFCESLTVVRKIVNQCIDNAVNIIR